jgi:CspA family cold shock protein
MPTGTVKFFTRFGFIVPDDGGADVFVHARDLGEAGLVTLNRGDRVEFDVRHAAGKTKAANLRRI